ncbi:S-layer domain protein [Paenibacillus curdlanolyticus YK9]|uniref:S-layer domain protein n=1 Tax=Paenibacillus curdlanolyticus YK9 TaxID=717606 RepID=E0IG53_9BACL|nr:S-layer homology domain-containing protein [Paenibacillus curdlanolyticus]EFM08633.1 S-layer domain protein [Paenibacillus curdlanolyticus YK9]
MMKKTMIAAALTLSLLAPLSNGQAFAAAPFTDIGGSSAQSQIESLQAQGIVHGVTEKEFQPKASLSGAQGISLIVRSMQLSLAAIDFNQAPTAEGYFSKVSNTAWYADDFVIAKANGLDIPADIDPSQPLTREQFAYWLVQGLEKTGQYPLIKMYININDEADLTVAYQGTIQRALLYKLTSLDADGNFKPKAIVTREDAAAMIYEAVQFVAAHKDSETGQAPTE